MHVGYIHVHIVGLQVAIFARYCTLSPLPNHETTTITTITSITTSIITTSIPTTTITDLLLPEHHHTPSSLLLSLSLLNYVFIKKKIIIGISIYRNSTIIIKQTTTTKNNNYQQHQYHQNKSSDHSTTYFDVTKHIRIVPPFQEREVDKYFLHFEKVAKNWPKESWTMLLQSVLLGKAREIFSQLTVEDSGEYDTVKQLILKGYELVPEAYRQKFRVLCKSSNKTFVEFAQEKAQLFDR
jgi:hypothetical protein